MSELALGSVVLIGDLNWRKGPVRHAIAAFLFGRRDRFDHLGMRCTVAWWRNQPYLVRFREVARD